MMKHPIPSIRMMALLVWVALVFGMSSSDALAQDGEKPQQPSPPPEKSPVPPDPRPQPPKPEPDPRPEPPPQPEPDPRPEPPPSKPEPPPTPSPELPDEPKPSPPEPPKPSPPDKPEPKPQPPTPPAPPERPAMHPAQRQNIRQAVDFVWEDTSGKRFAVLQVAPEGDFIQMLGFEEGLVLDFPLATERQQALAAGIEAALRAQGLQPQRQDMGDGTTTIQAVVGDYSQRAELALAVILMQVFDAATESEFNLISGER